MRANKFKAWDTEYNCWYAPIHEVYKGNLWELLLNFGGGLDAHTLKDGHTILQHESLWPNRYKVFEFTGVLDKNGNEIYNGHIITQYTRKGELVSKNFIVKWNDNGYYEIATINAGEPFTVPIKNAFYKMGEIIGHIFETPHLLIPENVLN